MLDYSLAYEYSQSTDAIVEAAMCTGELTLKLESMFDLTVL